MSPPPPPAGWTRDFLLKVDGWAKDRDPNTAFSTTVEPLPFHAMSRYPYPAGEHYPADAVHEHIGASTIHGPRCASCGRYGRLRKRYTIRERSPRVRITISKENYLKTISEAESEGEVVKAVTLTRWLHVSAPAVTMAIKRLKRDGLIEVGAEGQIALTGAGSRDRQPAAESSSPDRADADRGLRAGVVQGPRRGRAAGARGFDRFRARNWWRNSGGAGVCPHGNIVGMDSPGARRERGLRPLDEARRRRSRDGRQRLRARP